MLLVPCAHCQTEYADEFETLDDGHIGTLRCGNENCGREFWYIFYECLACGEETVFTWKEPPAPAELAGLICRDCGEPLSEASQEAKGENAAW